LQTGCQAIPGAIGVSAFPIVAPRIGPTLKGNSMADTCPESTRLETLLHKIRDGLGRSLDAIRDSAGSELPDVQVNDGDVNAAALYLRDAGLMYDGLRLHGEFARLQNRCMDEWFASMADGESQEYRDKLTDLFGPLPSQGNPEDSVVADRRVMIAGLIVQLSEFLDELIASVSALSETQPSDEKPDGEASAENEAVPANPVAQQSDTATSKSGGDTSVPTKSKRSTEKGEAQTKLIAALTKHHQYADGGCLNFEPTGNRIDRTASANRRPGPIGATASRDPLEATGESGGRKRRRGDAK
jgi:hypothetical protein